MASNNLTAILYGINDLRLEHTEIQEPGKNDVLLKMSYVGICGSDVHYFKYGRIGDFVVEQPMIIGHEASGIIIKLGSNVKNLKIGDRVAIEPGVPCRICIFCKSGRYNLCKEIQFCATPPVHGTLRRYYKHAADFCFKLPDNVSLEEGALLEPLSVGVHACKKAGVSIGSSVLILGAGPIGLVTLITAKAMGAKTVIICDLLESRLNIAKELNADQVYTINSMFKETENVKNIEKLFNDLPNIVIDASGAESSVRLAIMVAKPGGIVILIGMGSNEIKVPLIHILTKEINIKGVFRYANDYKDALELISKNKTNIGSIVTHRYKIEETLKAFDMSHSNKNNAIKVLIHCN